MLSPYFKKPGFRGSFCRAEKIITLPPLPLVILTRHNYRDWLFYQRQHPRQDQNDRDGDEHDTHYTRLACGACHLRGFACRFSLRTFACHFHLIKDCCLCAWNARSMAAFNSPMLTGLNVYASAPLITASFTSNRSALIPAIARFP